MHLLELSLWQEALDELVACGLVDELTVAGDPVPRYRISALLTNDRPRLRPSTDR